MNDAMTNRGVIDRTSRGPSRPCRSVVVTFRHLHQPAQSPGPYEPASRKDGPTGGGRMTASPVFVGIDISTTRLDLAVRPAGPLRSAPHDEAGRAMVVEQLRWPPPGCRSASSTRARCGTLPKP